MPKLAFGIGALLILLGLGSYIATGAVSWTALIPTFFGLPIAGLGAVALKRVGKVRMHAMHAAVVVALLGLAGSASGVPGVVRLLGGGDVARPPAAIAKAIMALLCLVFVALSIKAFIDARRKPPAQPKQP
jgi:hypothetical protein